MAKTETDVSVTSSWIDLVATYAELASASSYVQNKGPGELLVNFSADGTAPADASGILLKRGESVSGTAAHIWVAALGLGTVAGSGLTD